VRQRVAVFVDGENIGAALARALTELAEKEGEAVLARVYGNVEKLNGWREAARFAVVHSGTGKNATDLLMSLDALDLALAGRFDTCVIGSSDGDYSHLAVKLRERCVRVVGAGEANTPKQFVQKCSEFVILRRDAARAKEPPPAGIPNKMDDLDTWISEAFREAGAVRSLPIPDLNAALRRHGFMIGKRPEKTWKRLIQTRQDRYEHIPGSIPHLGLREPRAPV
jgi:hypothetical protein